MPSVADASTLDERLGALRRLVERWLRLRGAPPVERAPESEGGDGQAPDER